MKLEKTKETIRGYNGTFGIELYMNEKTLTNANNQKSNGINVIRGQKQL
jgi:hypothetical protein